MSAAAVIELDTTPPLLALEDPQRPDPDTIVVPYSLSDDGEIIEATLTMLDGTRDLAVLPDHVEGWIDPDTDTYTAYVKVVAQDDVWNRIERQVAVTITSAVGEITENVHENPATQVRLRENPQMGMEMNESPKMSLRFKERPELDSELGPDTEIE